MAATLFKIAGLGGLVDSLLGDASDGFARGFVLEIVDDRKPQSPETFGLVLNPTRYELSEPFQAELTPTEDNTVVAEETGIITREIMLEGTFGLRPKRGTGATAHKMLGGNEHFLAMRRFFRSYSDLKKDPNKSPHTFMALHVLKDDDHWKVVPREFTSPRDSRLARVHRLYRLQLTAVDGPDFRKFKQPKKALGFFDRVAQLSKSLNDARAFFADATADLARVRRRTVGNFDALLIQAAGIITAAGNFVRGLRATIRIPIQLVRQTAQALESLADGVDAVTSFDTSALDPDAYLRDFGRALRGLSHAFDDFASHPEAFDQPVAGGAAALSAGAGDVNALYTAQRLAQDDLDNNRAGATVGTRTQVTSGSDRDGGLDLGSVQGVTSWTVKRGDSLGSIANATSSAPEAIILLNDLQYPYISEGGGPGIAKPGDKLMVPSGAAQDETAVGPPPDQADYFVTDDVLYGVDLALDPDLLTAGVLEVKVDEAHGAGDADLVYGVPAVVQGIAIVLNSEAGSTTALPEVGIHAPVGERGTVQHTLMAAVRLRDGLLVDERVDTIDEMSVVLDADVLTQEVSLSLVGGRRVGLAVPFGKASGAGSRAAR